MRREVFLRFVHMWHGCSSLGRKLLEETRCAPEPNEHASFYPAGV